MYSRLVEAKRCTDLIYTGAIMILKNDTTRYHLYYLLVNDLRNDKFDGLSHVAEHTLLIPEDIGLSYIAKGYTCTSHVCLYFGSKSLADLEKVDQMIMSGKAIASENVCEAKEQVIEEILQLCNKTKKFEDIVSFITETRVNKSALGNPVEVANIQTEDVAMWFKEKKRLGQIYRFLYKDAHNMISSSLVHVNQALAGRSAAITCHTNCDSFLYTVSPNNARNVQIYFRIPNLLTKTIIIEKAFYEYFIQQKLAESLGIETYIADNFFDIKERYVRMDFEVDNKSTVKDMIGRIRTAVNSICKKEMEKYFNDFKNYLLKLMSRVENNSEVMNSIKNLILYSIPQITLEDVKEIEYAQLGEFPKEKITSVPLKVVIT